MTLFPRAVDAQEVAPATSAATSSSPPATPAAPVRPAEPPWELRPYQVAVEVTFSASPALTDSVQEQLLAGVRSRLENDLGSMWRLSLTAAPLKTSMPAARLVSQTSADAKRLWFEHPAEKVIALAVENVRNEWKFEAREWDRASESLSPVARGLAIDDRLSVGTAAGTVKKAFRALVQVDAVAGRNATMRLRAGELQPPELAAAQLSPGKFVVPFVRSMNRKGELHRVQFTPWTLLRVESVDRAFAEVLAFSVFPSPVAPTKKRQESLAIEIRRTFSETKLQVVPRTNKGNPLAAARVDIVDRLALANDPAVDRTTMRTDRDGMVIVPADPTPQIRYAIVSSGTATLARVPFCPGVEPKLVIEVSDDAPRLLAEGEVSLLEADLIEMVARRKVLLMRADTASKAGKADDVKSLVTELRTLPTQPQFQQRIDLTRTLAVEGAREKKDTVAEARIRKMYAALGEASKTHLDDEKFQEQLKDVEDVAAIRKRDPGGKK